MNLKFFILFCVLQSIHGFTNYILGGKDAPDGYAPYQCSMQLNRQHVCGCTIISNNSILTSAYCVKEYDLKDVEIMVGTQDLNKVGIYHKIDGWEVHENFDGYCGYNMGIIRVQKPFEFNGKVGLIELETNEVPDGTELEFSGFGTRESSDRPRRLQIIKLNVSNHQDCKKKYNDICEIGPQHLCTSSKRTGTCEGDGGFKGGPLVLRSGSKTKLVGILNFALLCAARPDGFSRVSYFNDWIKNHTGQRNVSMTIRPSMLCIAVMFLHFIINRKKWCE